MPARTILVATLALAAAGVSGQTVHRCGNSYSTQACPGGTAIDVSDPGTPVEARRAGAAAAADQKRADALEKQRLEQERKAPKALVIGPKEPVAPAAKKDPGKNRKDKPHDPEVFTAAGPKPPKK